MATRVYSFPRTLLAACVFFGLSGADRAFGLDEVTLQLRGDHEFRFAGYYAAQWLGFYEKAGLQVEIRSAVGADGAVDPVAAVLEGSADFGIGSTDVLLAVDRGHELVFVSSVFQRSGAAAFTAGDRRLQALDDLVRLRVARVDGSLEDIEFHAMLVAEGIAPSSVGAAGMGDGLVRLLAGAVDVAVANRLDAVPWAAAAGRTLNALSPASYGIDFYGDAIFTTPRAVADDPRRVQRFVEASLEGWRHAMEHPHAIAERIAELERDRPLSSALRHNRVQAGIVADLLMYPIVTIGDTDPRRWTRIYDHLVSVGVARGGYEGHAFAVDPRMAETVLQERITRALVLGLALLLGLGVIAAGWIVTLRRLVARRSRDLRTARDRAYLASRTKSDFLGNVSHELRSPLNAILGFSEVIRGELVGPVEHRNYLEYADDIHRSGLHLLEIVDKLLDLARIDSGRVQLHPECLDVPALVFETLNTVREEVAEARLRLETDLEPGLPGLLTDKRAVQQILLNLLSNAVKFTPPEGFITVSARRAEPERVVLAVQDTGIGIAPDRLDRVTEPFIRTDDQFTRSHQGTGLGLPIARLLARLLGGDLTLSSVVGAGTTVRVALPMAPADAAAPARQATGVPVPDAT